MRMSRLKSVFGVAMATALGLGIAVQGASARGEEGAAQGAPPAGAQGGARGGGRGFSLPPLLMETDAFPDGGIVLDPRGRRHFPAFPTRASAASAGLRSAIAPRAASS